MTTVGWSLSVARRVHGPRTVRGTGPAFIRPATSFSGAVEFLAGVMEFSALDRTLWDSRPPCSFLPVLFEFYVSTSGVFVDFYEGFGIGAFASLSPSALPLRWWPVLLQKM